MDPKGLKKGPTGPPRPPKVTKLAKVEPRMALDGPRAPWENAEISQGSFMVAPRRGQEGPRWPQEGPRESQDGPRRAQDDPKRGRDAA